MRAYRTIRGTWVAEFEEKKSRFIGHATHVESEEEAISFRHGIRERIPEASHYVSAYTIHDPFLEHYSDAKEPHGTAGPPVLQVIKSLELEDVVCVVARIFGGTLLGRGGLMRAYTKAAQLAFAEAEVVLCAPCRDTMASLEYPLYEQAVNDMFRLTSTAYAPWIILQSNDKRYARIQALRTINDALEKRLHG